jgi:hypothetical protein
MLRVIVTTLVVLAGTAHAQGAWVNDPKSLTTTLGYEYVPSTAVVYTPDKSTENRPTTNHIMTLSAEYVPIENLALELSVPFAAVRYDRDCTTPAAMRDPNGCAHFPPGKWDDTKFHYTPTDFRFGARYQLLDEPILAVSPYVAASLPMTNYETVGFATGGRNLRQLHFGVSIGRSFGPLLRHLFFTAGYEYTVSQKFDANPDTAKYNQNRSDGEAQLGYVLLDGDLVINVAGNCRYQQDGIKFEDAMHWTANELKFHDPILKESYIFYGGGLSYALSTSLTLSANVRFFLHGYNTRDQSLYGLDLAWRAL